MKVTIKNTTGSVGDTKIIAEDGTDLTQSMAVESILINGKRPITASMHLMNVGIDCVADMGVSDETEKWLNKMGYFKQDANSSEPGSVNFKQWQSATVQLASITELVLSDADLDVISLKRRMVAVLGQWDDDIAENWIDENWGSNMRKLVAITRFMDRVDSNTDVTLLIGGIRSVLRDKED